MSKVISVPLADEGHQRRQSTRPNLLHSLSFHPHAHNEKMASLLTFLFGQIVQFLSGIACRLWDLSDWNVPKTKGTGQHFSMYKKTESFLSEATSSSLLVCKVFVRMQQQQHCFYILFVVVARADWLIDSQRINFVCCHASRARAPKINTNESETNLSLERVDRTDWSDSLRWMIRRFRQQWTIGVCAAHAQLLLILITHKSTRLQG